MKIYKSKIDWWWGLPLLYPLFLSVTSLIDGEWIGFAGLGLIVGFVLFLSKTTQYIIDGNQLTVKSCWIVCEKIEIGTIRKVEKTNSILSSPALSLDRIAIRYNRFDDVYISPKYKDEFVAELVKENPNIEVTI
jgi:hypothetical protein